MADREPQLNASQINVNRDNLFREENYTDTQVATIRRLIPVKSDGSPDASRPEQFIGQTHIMTQSGPLPINTRIEAANLDEAFEKFPAAVEEAVQRLLDEAERQQRESSRIVTPDQMGPPRGQSGNGGITLS